jgi:RNA polymerase sigma factor (sigma-70 family)
MDRPMTQEETRKYLRYVDFIAGRVRRRHETRMSQAELISIGVVGLLEAWGRWDPERSRFTTFAYYRVYGAVLDAIRNEYSLGAVEKYVVDSDENAFDCEDVRDCEARSLREALFDLKGAAPLMRRRMTRIAVEEFILAGVPLSVLSAREGISKSVMSRLMSHEFGRIHYRLTGKVRGVYGRIL